MERSNAWIELQGDFEPCDRFVVTTRQEPAIARGRLHGRSTGIELCLTPELLQILVHPPLIGQKIGVELAAGGVVRTFGEGRSQVRLRSGPVTVVITPRHAERSPGLRKSRIALQRLRRGRLRPGEG